MAQHLFLHFYVSKNLYVKSNNRNIFPCGNKMQCSWERNLENKQSFPIGKIKKLCYELNAHWFEFLFSFSIFQIIYFNIKAQH